jgi:hypothetical protein
MKNKILVLLFSLATFGLASCGGSNDVASSGANAVSAAAPATTTEPKVNGQVDERTGVAPVAAKMTIASWCSTYNYSGTSMNVCGCLEYYPFGPSGRLLTTTQQNACISAMDYSNQNQIQSECNALGGISTQIVSNLPSGKYPFICSPAGGVVGQQAHEGSTR